MLLVFGAVNLDFVFPVHRLPGAGETFRQLGSWAEPGGKAVNQAIAAHRDGARVELVGAIGGDGIGGDLLGQLKAEGLGCRYVARLDGATGRAAVAVSDDGHTSVLVDPGVTSQAMADQVPDRLLRPSTTVLVQLEADTDQIVRLIARARAGRARVVLNFSPPRLISAETLRTVDVLVANGFELSWLAEHLGCGNSPASLQAALGVTVIGMSGVQGAEAVSTDSYMRMEAFPVAMSDTTAAADAFTGVLAAALDRGNRLSVAFRRAIVAAGLAVTKVGTGRTMPRHDAINQALVSAPSVRWTEQQLQN